MITSLNPLVANDKSKSLLWLEFLMIAGKISMMARNERNSGIATKQPLLIFHNIGLAI